MQHLNGRARLRGADSGEGREAVRPQLNEAALLEVRTAHRTACSGTKRAERLASYAAQQMARKHSSTRGRAALSSRTVLTALNVL